MVVQKLNFGGIATMTLLTSLISLIILLNTNLNNMTVFGIYMLITLISFNLYANLKIKTKKEN